MNIYVHGMFKEKELLKNVYVNSILSSFIPIVWDDHPVYMLGLAENVRHTSKQIVKTLAIKRIAFV